MFANNNLTPEQRAEINRANAQHSTGAKTEAGRSASSRNRTVHGLAIHRNGMFCVTEDESEEEFVQFKAALLDEHKPVGETEWILVTSMAESHWLANRAQRLLNLCLEPKFGLIEDPRGFPLYLRYLTTHTRAFHKSLNDLIKLRAAKRKEQAGFEAQQRQEAKMASKKRVSAVEDQAKQEEDLLNNPEYRDLGVRMMMASKTKGPEYHTLKEEFERKFGAVVFGKQNSQAQAA